MLASRASTRLVIKKECFLDRADALFARGDAMRHYHVIHLRRGGSLRRRGLDPAGITRRWGSCAARWWIPPGPIVRFLSPSRPGFPRTSLYMSSHTVSSRPFVATGSASLDQSFREQE